MSVIAVLLLMAVTGVLCACASQLLDDWIIEERPAAWWVIVLGLPLFLLMGLFMLVVITPIAAVSGWIERHDRST